MRMITILVVVDQVLIPVEVADFPMKGLQQLLKIIGQVC